MVNTKYKKPQQITVNKSHGLSVTFKNVPVNTIVEKSYLINIEESFKSNISTKDYNPDNYYNLILSKVNRHIPFLKTLFKEKLYYDYTHRFDYALKLLLVNKCGMVYSGPDETSEIVGTENKYRSRYLMQAHYFHDLKDSGKLKHFLPVVYPPTRDMMFAFATYLKSKNYSYLWMNEDETDAKFFDNVYTTGRFVPFEIPDTVEGNVDVNTLKLTENSTMSKNPICLLISPSHTEGFSLTHSPSFIALGLCRTTGDAEQAYGRVLRKYNDGGKKGQYDKKIYQFFGGSSLECDSAQLAKYANKFGKSNQKFKCIYEEVQGVSVSKDDVLLDTLVFRGLHSAMTALKSQLIATLPQTTYTYLSDNLDRIEKVSRYGKINKSAITKIQNQQKAIREYYHTEDIQLGILGAVSDMANKFFFTLAGREKEEAGRVTTLDSQMIQVDKKFFRENKYNRILASITRDDAVVPLQQEGNQIMEKYKQIMENPNKEETKTEFLELNKLILYNSNGENIQDKLDIFKSVDTCAFDKLITLITMPDSVYTPYFNIFDIFPIEIAANSLSGNKRILLITRDDDEIVGLYNGDPAYDAYSVEIEVILDTGEKKVFEPKDVEHIYKVGSNYNRDNRRNSGFYKVYEDIECPDKPATTIPSAKDTVFKETSQDIVNIVAYKKNNSWISFKQQTYVARDLGFVYKNNGICYLIKTDGICYSLNENSGFWRSGSNFKWVQTDIKIPAPPPSEKDYDIIAEFNGEKFYCNYDNISLYKTIDEQKYEVSPREFNFINSYVSVVKASSRILNGHTNQNLMTESFGTQPIGDVEIDVCVLNKKYDTENIGKVSKITNGIATITTTNGNIDVHLNNLKIISASSLCINKYFGSLYGGKDSLNAFILLHGTLMNTPGIIKFIPHNFMIMMYQQWNTEYYKIVNKYYAKLCTKVGKTYTPPQLNFIGGGPRDNPFIQTRTFIAPSKPVKFNKIKFSDLNIIMSEFNAEVDKILGNGRNVKRIANDENFFLSNVNKLFYDAPAFPSELIPPVIRDYDTGAILSNNKTLKFTVSQMKIHRVLTPYKMLTIIPILMKIYTSLSQLGSIVASKVDTGNKAIELFGTNGKTITAILKNLSGDDVSYNDALYSTVDLIYDTVAGGVVKIAEFLPEKISKIVKSGKITADYAKSASEWLRALYSAYNLNNASVDAGLPGIGKVWSCLRKILANKMFSDSTDSSWIITMLIKLFTAKKGGESLEFKELIIAVKAIISHDLFLNICLPSPQYTDVHRLQLQLFANDLDSILESQESIFDDVFGAIKDLIYNKIPRSKNTLVRTTMNSLKKSDKLVSISVKFMEKISISIPDAITYAYTELNKLDMRFVMTICNEFDIILNNIENVNEMCDVTFTNYHANPYTPEYLIRTDDDILTKIYNDTEIEYNKLKLDSTSLESSNYIKKKNFQD